jgi:hypothetical protein
MAGIGKGNWPRLNAKELVEDCLKLDCNRLAKGGSLIPGVSGIISWPKRSVFSDSQAVSFTVTSRPHFGAALQISFRRNKSEDVEQFIALQSTRTNFGGRRIWFLCPATAEGKPCRRRCAKLYFHQGRFACRSCHGLAYESQREGRAFERLLKRTGYNTFSRSEIRELSRVRH